MAFMPATLKVLLSTNKLHE